MNGPCPCGSGKRYAVCCGALHGGVRPARTAEALMRGRYSAYVLGLEAYLLESWHPDTRPPTLDLSQGETRWLGLQIHRAVAGGPHDASGQVKFTARFRLEGHDHRLSELSTFARVGGRWVYVDGEVEGEADGQTP